MKALLRGLAGALAGACAVVVALALSPGSASDLVGGPEAGLADALGSWFGGSPYSWSVRPGAPLVPWLLEAGLGSFFRLGGALALLAALSIAPSQRLAWVGALPTFLAAHLGIAALDRAALAGMDRGWWDRPGWFPLPSADHPLREGLALLLLAGSAGLWPAAREQVRRSLDQFNEQTWVLATLGRGEPPPWGRAGVLAAAEWLSALLPAAVTALILVEASLLLPGLGALLWRAAQARDLPLALGAALPLSMLVGLTHGLRGGLIAVLDPRPGGGP